MILNVDADAAEHVHHSNAAALSVNVSVETIRADTSPRTYAMARDAGTPRTATLMADRSSAGQQHDGHWIPGESVLSVNTPAIRRPNISDQNPTLNWLSFPMAGMKGLPCAAVQTS